MKIVLAHPGQQHAFKVAAGLKKAGILCQFITAVYDKPENVSMWIAHKLVREQDVQKIENRKSPDIDNNDVTTYCTFLSLLVIILSRSKKTKKLAYWLDRKIADHFGILVAKYAIKNSADAVICFSMNERTCFEYLKKHAPHIKRIVDCANSPVDFMREIYQKDIERTGNTVLKDEAGIFWNANELKKQQRGIEATQYFLAPSCFVKSGLEFCGVQPEKITVIPYGTNFPVHDNVQNVPDSVKFIYVGQVSYRKGMHYLLRAFADLEQESIELTVVGAINPVSGLYDDYKRCKNIHFIGNVSHEKVKELLLASNVFVFASLSEGLSLSCIEALSCGLPIVCSTNSGANDLITDNENGFVFEPYEVETIKNRVRFFAEHPNQIPRFSKNALATAREITWNQYASNLRAFLNRLS